MVLEALGVADDEVVAVVVEVRADLLQVRAGRLQGHGLAQLPRAVGEAERVRVVAVHELERVGLVVAGQRRAFASCERIVRPNWSA